jgi:hypothetical protein
MTPLACPGCGAAVTAPPNATQYQCQYCKHTIQLEAPKPAAPPPAAQAPAVIVVHHNHNDASPVIYSGGSAWGTYWTIRLAIFVIVMICSAGGWGFRRWHGHGVAADLSGASVGWDGTSPLSCGGNDEYDVSGVTASFTAGQAILASGNCHVTCRDCNLKAPVAVEASGNGNVQLINGVITGTTTSLNATGNGTINVLGNAKVNGPFHQSANGTVSGVTAPAPAATPPPVAAAVGQPAAAHPAVLPAVHTHLPPPTPAPTVRRR